MLLPLPAVPSPITISLLTPEAEASESLPISTILLPVVKTSDVAGQEISLVTAERRFFIGSDYEREKLIEVSQDLPYPMTVLSVASNVNVEGA